MPDNDGAQVGKAHIEITPKINTKQAAAAAKKAATEVARALDGQLSKSLSGLPNTASKAIRDFQRDQTKGVLREIGSEAQRVKDLAKQRDAALKQNLRGFELEKKKIAESIKAQKSLADQREATLSAIGKAEYEAYAIERKRIAAIEKARLQAFEQEKKKISDSITAQKALARQKDESAAADKKNIDRTLAELNSWYDKKRALEKADQAEAEKASKQFIEDQLKRDKYLRARLSGMSASQAAGAATGKVVGANEIRNQFEGLTRSAQLSGRSVSSVFNKMSHELSQWSTRIGLASFQLQLLGGFATTFFTGPAAIGMAAMAREGLQFAVSIDYARASMKALLGPTADVEKIIRDIQKIAIESPLFNTEEAVAYAQKLAAVGVKEKDLAKTIEALGNIFLTGGVAGPERAGLALMAYTQILSKGTIGMDDLRQQLAEHLPNAFGVFGEAAKILGYKDLPALQKAMKEGKVTSEQLNQAFITLGNSEKYLQGATNAAQTLGGVWQGLKEEAQSRLGMAFDANRVAIINAINGIRPVVMGFIDGVVKALPGLLVWLGRLVGEARDLKAQYDALNPAQKQLVQQLTLAGLAAGPAAIAIGIFGTALSGAANAASLLWKSIAIVGAGASALGGTVAAVIFAIGALVVAVAALYANSEGMRKAVEKVFNRIKDLIATVLLPVVDLLIGSVQSLEKTFGFLGLKSEHLAYILMILAIPIGLLVVALGTVVVIIKAVQLAMLILASIAYALSQVVVGLIWGFEQLVRLSAALTTDDNRKAWLEGVADGAKSARKEIGGLIDVSAQWKGLTEGNSTATDGLQKKLAETDLTTTGLGGAFAGLNGHTEMAIQKQFTLEEAIDNARRAMESQKSATIGLQDASDNYNKSLLGLKDSIKQNKQTLNEKTRAGQANRDMLKQAAGASYEMMLQDIRSGVPMEEAIKRHKERTAALKKEFGKNKETQAAAQGLIDTYGKVPEDVVTLLKTMGYPDVQSKLIEILAQQKVAANPQMNPAKALAAEKKAWAIEKRDLKGPGYKTGGLIRGPGGPTGDKIPIMASDEEYMIQAKAAKNLGTPALDFINKHGALPIGGEYAKGGPVKWPVNFDLSKTKIPELIGGGPNTGGMGVSRMMAVLRQAFPGLPLISGYRPGAITSTGNRSYHGMNRAVDLPPRADVFNWISQRYGRGTKELIYTPMGGRQLKNGKPHVFSGGTIAQDHWDHVHWAYDNGGAVPPNTPFINKTGTSELMLNSAQGAALEEKIANSDRPINVSVYVDGVKRDAAIVFDEKFDELIQVLGGV